MLRASLLAALLIAMAGWAWAVEPGDEGDVAHRLLRQAGRDAPAQLGPLGRAAHGLWNMIIAPLELPATMMAEVQARDNLAEGMLWGGGSGLANFLAREVAGIAELTTIVVLKKAEPLYVRKLGEPAALPEPKP